jgi:short-subunit dehydrogenase
MPDLTLITGASRGIGRVFAERFARERHDLILVARGAPELEALAERLSDQHGVQVHVVPMDLSAPGAPEALFGEVSARGLSVTGLVNNAGFGLHGPHAEADPAALARMLNVNVTALTLLTRLFLPAMLARGRGTILNLASTAAFQPVAYFSAYAAAKAYVLSFTEGLAEEVRPRGVSVLALCPGPTRTGFFEAAGIRTGVLKYVDAVFMTPEAVVEAAMHGLARREVIRIPGPLNALMARTIPFLPRRLVSLVSGRLMQQSQR